MFKPFMKKVVRPPSRHERPENRREIIHFWIRRLDLQRSQFFPKVPTYMFNSASTKKSSTSLMTRVCKLKYRDFILHSSDWQTFSTLVISNAGLGVGHAHFHRLQVEVCKNITLSGRQYLAKILMHLPFGPSIQI